MIDFQALRPKGFTARGQDSDGLVLVAIFGY